MTSKRIAALGRKLSLFLALFADCFGRRDARRLLQVYVQGQLSNLHRKNAEAMALEFKTAPWTFDELYGRDGRFLDGLQSRRQVFVGEIPCDFHGWVQKPRVL